VPTQTRRYLQNNPSELCEGFAEPGDDSVLPQRDHGVEERRRDGLAYDGDAAGVDEQAGFYSGGFSDGAGGVVARVVTPLGEGSEGVREFDEQFRNLWIFPEFIFGGLIERKFIAEKSARPG